MSFKPVILGALTAISLATLPAMAQNENRNSVVESQQAVTDLSQGSTSTTITTTYATPAPTPYMPQSESPKGSASMEGNGGGDGGH